MTTRDIIIALLFVAAMWLACEVTHLPHWKPSPHSSKMEVSREVKKLLVKVGIQRRYWVERGQIYLEDGSRRTWIGRLKAQKE